MTAADLLKAYKLHKNYKLVFMLLLDVIEPESNMH